MLAAAVVTAVLGGVLAEGPIEATPSRSNGQFRIEVLSSAPDMVTGGDARIRVHIPQALRDRAVLLLNGDAVTASLAPAGDGVLEGVVSGMHLGENVLTVRPTGNGRAPSGPASLKVVNHPITGPVFSGPQQYPFVCKTERVGLGQPLVDNHDGEGFPVFAVDGSGAKTSEVVGWSRDCSAETQVVYRYRATDGGFRELPADGTRPGDMAQTTLLDGRTVDFVVRWERGTINRFIYSIAMLAPLGENPGEVDRSLWNGRVTWSFDGGVGIGHSQGELSTGNSMHPDSLGLGYAVLSSTATRTSVHYNLQVGGETALMVKERFIEQHGVPLYTVGVGGSGGGIQQYVYAQNHPGLIDAAVPQYSYPDMVTQTIHIGDCELLEHYMEVTDRDNPRWRNIEERMLLQGLHASSEPNLSSGAINQWNQIYGLYGAFGYPVPNRTNPQIPALTECRQGWFGLSPLALNPTYGSAGAGQELMSPPGVMDTVVWTHPDDLRNIYGVDEQGWARVAWGNEGVQYGLRAVAEGVLTPEEFLDVNANVGSWKRTSELVPEGCPFNIALCANPAQFDPWSSRNMALSPDGGATPAPRHSSDLAAVQGAYEAGMVFLGDIDIPIIDWRHYREEDLDMHNSHQSFAIRQRMLEADGDASNQVIWFTDGRPDRLSNETPLAFQVIDQWMANLRANPSAGVAGNKPAGAVDRCFTATGAEIAAGDGVWAGILDDAPAGVCTATFPLYTTSRIEAGGPIQGNVFACQRQSVDDAIAKGLYGVWEPTAQQRARLQAIFPTGVCDYSLPDAGRP
jgi:hypothetical protein